VRHNVVFVTFKNRFKQVHQQDAYPPYGEAVTN